MFWTRVLALTLSVSASSLSSAAPAPTPAQAPRSTTTLPDGHAPAAAGPPVASPSSEPIRELECPTVTHVGLEIDGTKLGEGAEFTVERVRRRLQATLRQWDIRPARDRTHPILQVTLSRLPDYAGYDLLYTARRGDEELPGVAGSAECRVCTEDEFVEHVDEGFERLLSRLTPHAVATPTPVTPQVRAPAPPVSAPPIPPPVTEDPYLVRMRRQGIGLSIAGGTVLGAGVAIAAVQPALVQDGVYGSRRLWVPGTVTAVVGATALVSGIILMVIEHRRRTSGRPAARAAKKR